MLMPSSQCIMTYFVGFHMLDGWSYTLNEGNILRYDNRTTLEEHYVLSREKKLTQELKGFVYFCCFLTELFGGSFGT